MVNGLKQTYKVGSVHDAIFYRMSAVERELQDLLLLLTTFAGVLLLLLNIKESRNNIEQTCLLQQHVNFHNTGVHVHQQKQVGCCSRPLCIYQRRISAETQKDKNEHIVTSYVWSSGGSTVQQR